MDEPRDIAAVDTELIKDLDRSLMSGYREIVLSVRWYDIARPHLFSHVRRRLSRLSEEYAALTPVLDTDDPFRNHTEARSRDLSAWQEHLHVLPAQARPVVWLLRHVPSVVGAVLFVLSFAGISLGITTFSALVIALIDACFCALVTIVPLTVYGAVGLLLIIGFTRKRDFLLGDAQDGRIHPDHPRSGENLYEIENRLTRALGQKPSGEIQFDALGWFVLSAFFFVFEPLVHIFEGDHVVSFLLLPPWVTGVVFALLGLFVLARSLGRRWGWRAEAPVAEPPRTVTA